MASSSAVAALEQGEHLKTLLEKSDQNTACLSFFLSMMQDANKAVVRLKHFIFLCGVRRNYKKLLEGRSSVRSQVAVLKKELEDLGIEGQWQSARESRNPAVCGGDVIYYIF